MVHPAPRLSRWPRTAAFRCRIATDRYDVAVIVGRLREGGAVYDLDPQSPLFFLSHGRATVGMGQQDPDRYVVEFFEELSMNVALLFGREAGSDPGFMDKWSLHGGRRWTGELFAAVGTCQVFIPLISMPLMQSDWCGREWDAFSRRTVVNQQSGGVDHETAIVPLLWSPIQAHRVPAVVREVQLFSPKGLPDSAVAVNYQREGLYGLRMLGMDSAYRAVIWQLAKRVVEIVGSHWVQPSELKGPGELRNVFSEVRT